MSETALVTGASGGIGRAIAQELLKEGYEVYGIGRTFNQPFHTAFFHEVKMDLLDTDELMDFLKKLPQEHLKVVVNCAGCAYYGLHEEMNIQKIQEINRVDLEVPEIIAGELIRPLRKNRGYLINIASVTAAGSSPHAAAYGAAKAGLRHFSHTLFDENRKYGMKVTCILPDLTESGLYRNADFTTAEEEDARLEPQDIADGVRYVLSLREGTVVEELMIRPQKNRIQKKKSS